MGVVQISMIITFLPPKKKHPKDPKCQKTLKDTFLHPHPKQTLSLSHLFTSFFRTSKKNICPFNRLGNNNNNNRAILTQNPPAPPNGNHKFSGWAKAGTGCQRFLRFDTALSTLTLRDHLWHESTIVEVLPFGWGPVGFFLGVCAECLLGRKRKRGGGKFDDLGGKLGFFLRYS